MTITISKNAIFIALFALLFLFVAGAAAVGAVNTGEALAQDATAVPTATAVPATETPEPTATPSLPVGTEIVLYICDQDDNGAEYFLGFQLEPGQCEDEFAPMGYFIVDWEMREIELEEIYYEPVSFTIWTIAGSFD